jgi:DedD protein
MTQKLKQRLVGATVLISLAVIFVPILLDGSVRTTTVVEQMEIPLKPVFSFEPISIPSKEQMLAPADEIKTAPKSIKSSSNKKKEPQNYKAKAAKKLVAAQKSKKKEINKPPLKKIPAAWAVQIASFTGAGRAQVLHDRLEEAGYRSFIEKSLKGSKTYFRVKVGPEIKQAEAEKLRDQVAEGFKLEGRVVQYRPGEK